MAQDSTPNGTAKVSELDGAAPDSTGVAPSYIIRLCLEAVPQPRNSSIMLLYYWTIGGLNHHSGADFSNYFCTYAFLYHQVILGIDLYSAFYTGVIKY
jgi:hypothetical protein